MMRCSVRVARHRCCSSPGVKETMLVLTRKLNESIVINDNVSVLVVEIRGDRVRLGIDAPKDVIVHRQEIYNAINETDPERSHKKSSAILAEPVA